jgi:RNA polymerase sigma-70 factor (ECF subfamily)
VQEPVAYLSTMVSRLALDQLKSARVTRQRYVGPWLPEPALTETAVLGPLETVELRESVSLATLYVMEQLSPPERGVFVLREAFDMPFAEIAEILELSIAGARQLFHRAHSRLALDRRRFRADPGEHATLLDLFLRAVASGDLDGLESMLADDVVVYSDGGGRVHAAVRPIRGRANVMKHVRGLLRRSEIGPGVRIVDANGTAAALLRIGDHRELVVLDVRDHRVAGIYGISNPEKLSYLDVQLANRIAERN